MGIGLLTALDEAPSVAAYARRTPRSAAEFARACRLLPGGVATPIHYKLPHPLFIARARGSRMWDVDGNEYVDYLMSFGTMIAGHAHPAIAEAIKRQADRGTLYCMPTSLAADLVEELQRRFPVLELVRFTSTGTEAVTHALRVARAATGRTRIVKAEGAYHGHTDPLLVSIMDSPLEALGPPQAPTSVVDSDGVPAETAAQATVVQFNDLASLEAVFDRFPGEIAAVVLEPLSESSGLIPPEEGYLEGVRDLTRRHGAVLIFDEVQTGARVAAGGATQLYGVTPDLLILGKAIGGGTPIGAFGGRRELMELLAPLGRTGVAGTFSANPLSMAAGLACLTVALTDDVYSEIHRLAARLADGQRRIAAAHDLPVSIANVGSIGDVFFAREHPRSAREALATCDTTRWHEFWFGMLSRGVIPMGSAWFKLWTVSAAHTEEDIDETLERTEETLTAIFGG